MIWLTWRQLRGSVAAVTVVLVVLAAALALTGPGLAARYDSGIAECTQDDSCIRFFDDFFGEYQIPFLAVGLVVLVLPALIGLFWGAPMIARELETGTHLLVWNQSITRRRWLAVKLGFTGVVGMAAACLCGLTATWWSAPLDKSATSELAQMAPLVFSARGIVPIGYAAFAFVLGVTVGMLLRRTLPAMALTLAVFTALQLGMPLLVRAHLMPPVTATFPLSQANVDQVGVQPGGGGSLQIFLEGTVPGNSGAWILANELVDRSGRTVSGAGEGVPIKVSTTAGPCARKAGPPNIDACMAEAGRLGYRQQASYQPLERFWAFQWIETGIYALLTLGLTWFSFWWIRRRLS